jgi:hypothetical protein
MIPKSWNRFSDKIMHYVRNDVSQSKRIRR